MDTLDTGLKVCIDSQATLTTFSEQFVNQPYAAALSLTSRENFIVDLGANRGLFLLFACHYFRRQGAADPRFVCVEAAGPNYRRLRQHVTINRLESRVTTIQGAVCGQRSGSVNFYYSSKEHQKGLIVDGARLTTHRVPVIDLAAITDVPRIDVLKLDIEGAEQEVLTEYPEVLEKTQVVIGEFHLRSINYLRCQAILEKSGLTFRSHTSQYADRFNVDLYSR